MRSFYSSQNLRQLSDATLEQACERSLSRAWWRDKALSVAAPVIMCALYAGAGALGAGAALLLGAPVAATVAAAIVTAAVAGTGGVMFADFVTQVYEMHRNDEDLKLKDEVRRRERAQLEPRETPAPSFTAPAATQAFTQSANPGGGKLAVTRPRPTPNKLDL
jgi:uncharacterized membrane protein (DUF485 family)